MKNQAGKETVSRFLEHIKTLITAGNYDFIPRRKNMQALARRGLTIQDAKEEMLTLSAADYYKGPKQDLDRARPGEVWEFKKDIDGMQFYVKVKVVQENGKHILKCLGFHEDDYASE